MKTWPPFEILPREAIKAMFVKDIKGYTDFEADEFFPHPDPVLAAYDEEKNRWALVMEDADAFAEHKVHESELAMDEVQSMIPQLVDLAVRWEGCHEGANADKLAAMGIDLWASDANLGMYKAVMARGAPFYDKFINTETMGTPSWDSYLGPNFSVEYTKRVGAFFTRGQPSQGATCTLAHGDLRGDNIFFTPKGPRFPHGWLVIDFQLMFRGPIPSDLAYLMNSGSVLPDVYTGENLKTILRAFYDGFKTKTHVYKDYTYEQFEQEYVMMSSVLYVYYAGMGAAFFEAGALANETATRVELGGKGVKEEDLAPQEIRQRMWWKKANANLRETFKAFGQYELIQSLPCDDPPPKLSELPEHLS